MKRFKKLLAAMLVVALVIPAIQIVAPQIYEVQAEETTNQGDKLFAGYYADEQYSLPASVKSGYKKLVNADLLSVKLQLKSNDDGTYALRMITSVDSLNYKKAGFKISIDFDDDKQFEENESTSWSTYKVVERIDAKNSKMEYEYSPKVIDTASEYFVTGIMTVDGYYDKNFLIEPFWITKDGTEVYGENRWFSIDDLLDEEINSHINIPIEMDQDEFDTVDGALINGIPYTIRESYYDDAYGHFSVEVDKTSLPSASEVTIGGKTVIYRNLYSTYTGTKDTSFYDKYADNDAFIIASQADLYGLSGKGITADLTGKTIYLVSDISLNDTEKDNWTTGATAWEPIANFKGTFDGQMHTISGLYQSHSYGMFKNTFTSTTVKNFELVESYITHNGTSFNDGVGSIVGTAKGGTIDTVSSQATVNTNQKCVGGLVGIVWTEGLAINNCQYTGSLTSSLANIAGAGGLVGTNQGPLSVTNSMFSGTMTVSTPDGKNSLSGGIIGGMNCTYGWGAASAATAEIIGCMSNGTITCTTTKAVGTIVGQIVDLTASGSLLRNNVSCHASLSTIGSGSKATTDKTLKNEVSTTDSTTLYGAEGWATTLLNDDYFVAVTNATPELKSFSERETTELADVSAVQRIVDTSWYDSEATVKNFTIYTEEEFAGLIDLAATYYFANTTVNLGADMILNEGDVPAIVAAGQTPGKTYTPIAHFNGTFNGNGKTISGLYISQPTASQVALFKAMGGSASDFRLINSYIEGGDTVAGIVGRASGTVENIYCDATIVSNGDIAVYNGGIVGQVWTGTLTINNCWYDGTMEINRVSNNGWTVVSGGILGANVQGTATITNCLYTGQINTTSEGYSLFLGGINGGTGIQYNGANHSAACAKTTIIGCISTGDFETESANNNRVAAILGGSWADSNADNATAVITNCYGLSESWKYASSYIEGTASTEGITLFADMKDDQLQRLDMAYWIYIQGGTPELRSFIKGTAYVAEDTQITGGTIGSGETVNP